MTACSRDTGTSGEPEEAHRIVSLAPAFTETLIALGAADRIVGVTRFDPDVPGKPDVARVGDAQSVNLEALAALSPDAVIVNSTVLADVLRPIRRRAHVLVVPTDRLEDAFAMVATLGDLTGRQAESRAMRERMQAALQGAQARAAERAAAGVPAPRVLFVVQRRPFYSAGRGSFLDDLLTAVGAVNVVGDVDQPWPALSEETVVARAPDVILDASLGDADTEEGRAALAADWRRFPSIPAVAQGRVQVIREDAVFRAGPRLGEAVLVLERLLYPPETGAAGR